MKRFKKPYKIEDNKGVRFKMFDGSESKVVFDALPFNAELGVFPILNKYNEIIEYMDCVGNFTKSPTVFAKYFSDYIQSTGKGITYGYPYYEYFTKLLDFPSKYFIDQKIRNIVKNEEMYKIKLEKEKGKLGSLIKVVKYRNYVKKIYKNKISKAKELIKKVKLNHGVDVLYYEI